MKIIKKKQHAILSLALALLAACLLCGCMPRFRVTVRSNLSDTDLPRQPYATAAPLPTAPPALPPEADTPDEPLYRQQYGTVGLLSEPTVLVSVFLNDPAGGSTWDEESMDEARRKTALAVDWISEQAARYGTDATIYFDDGSAENAGLRHTYLVTNRLDGGEDGESDDVALDEFDALCQTLDTDALHRQYGTDKVGFLLFLPLDGCSFTMVHYLDDGPYYVQEYSCLYRYDIYSGATMPESPSVYAHEILHLFGAPDLYEGSSDPFVTDALIDYVAAAYPDEIMHNTYQPDGSILYDGITQSISPLVAYRLGLVPHCDELLQFPALADPPPGQFGSDRSTALPADLGVAV